MPSRPPRVCNRCRKPAPANGRCSCKPAWEGSSYGTSGTDTRQRRMRAAQLEAEPICQWPGCEALATTADHIVNLTAGGARYDPTNLQSLCDPHHDQKTRSEAQVGRKTRSEA